MATSGSANVISIRQEMVDNDNPEQLYGRDKTSVEMPSDSELVIKSAIPSQTPAWPWAGGGQFNSPFYAPYDTQSFRAPSTPCFVLVWATPYPQAAFPAPLNTTVSMGVLAIPTGA